MRVYPHSRRIRAWSLKSLETRLAPSATTELLSRADSSFISDSGGGASYIGAYQVTYPNTYANTPFSPQTNQISRDGRYVVFSSAATNLVAGLTDVNNAQDIFVFDRQLNQNSLISHIPNSSAIASNGDSFNPVISGDGRYVSYTSLASNLVAGFSDNIPEVARRNVYLFDRLSETTTLISKATGTVAGGGDFWSDRTFINYDGRIIAFQSKAKNLVEGEEFFQSSDHAYLFDRDANSVTLINHAYISPILAMDGLSTIGGISDDGRYVCYYSAAEGLVAGVSVAPFTRNVYLFDRATGKNQLVSRSASSPQIAGNGYSNEPLISRDGRYVTFTSDATNLIANGFDFNGSSNPDVYLYDRIADQITLVSRAEGFPTYTGDGASKGPSISDDGRYVAFVSNSSNLVSGFTDGNGTQLDVYLYDRLTGSMALTSRSTMGNATGNNGENIRPVISGDGSVVVFSSQATDLMNGFVDRNNWIGDGPGQPDFINYDVFAYDRANGSIALVSNQAMAANIGGNDRSHGALVSADGRLIAYNTWANDQVSGLIDANFSSDVILVDRASSVKSMLSRRFGIASASAGGMSDLRLPISNIQWVSADSQHVSHNGRFVVFTSLAENVVPGQVDTNHGADVFVYDRWNQSTQLVSRATGTIATAADRPSANPVISGDGRFVAYASLASNLVSGFVDSNGVGGNYDGTDVYLFDCQTGLTQLVSRQFGSPNVGGNGTSATFTTYFRYSITINADGRNVAYRSLARDLVPGFIDGNGAQEDLYLFDRFTQTNTLVSRSATNPNMGGNHRSNAPRLSDDGRFLAFSSLAGNLDSGMTGSGVFVYDRDLGTLAMVSHAWGSATMGNGGSDEPRISGDGRWITYLSAAADLVPGGVDNNFSADVFLYDRLTGTNQLVSHSMSSPVNAGNYSSDVQDISADGRFVVFTSRATDLVPGFVDQNGVDLSGYYDSDVFLFDRDTGVITLVSRSAGTAATGGMDESLYPRISGDGRFVTYVSTAYDLVDGFVNGHASMSGYPTPDVYLYDRLTNTNRLASHSQLNSVQSSSASSTEPTISRNGAVVVFSSQGDNLTDGDANGLADIYAFVQHPSRVQSVQINDGSPQRSNIRSLTITFDDAVFVESSPLSVTSSQGQALGGVQWVVEYENNSTIMTLTFSGAGTEFGSLADGKYTLSLIASKISGIGFLDGNGDGVGGDDYVYTFHRLFGDANGDGKANAADFASFIDAYYQPGNTFDFNDDGVVSASDFNAFRLRYGIALVP